MGKVILLDNGHGEETKGKRSPDESLLEYKYTREITSMIQEELLKLGYDCRRIVPEKNDIGLSVRCKRVNNICDEVGKSNVLLVSVHCNAASNEGWKNARGWSAYTTQGTTNSDILAEEMYKVAYEELKEYSESFEESELKRNQRPIRKDSRDGDMDLEENFWILKNTKCPAILTENLFQDNKKDVEFLLSEEGKQIITNIHVKGIINYINKIS